MCYRTKHITKVENMEKFYDIGLYKEESRAIFDKPRYNINGFAHNNQLIIAQEYADYLITAKWGLAPTTTTSLSEYYKKAAAWGAGLNARGEKAFTDRNYRESIFEKRCIIPLSGFYEPHTTSNNLKVPFHFKYKDDGILSMAGIYTILDGGLVTFTIFTREANEQFSKIHNVKKKGSYRMPLVLDRSVEDDWLNPDTHEEYLKDLLLSFTTKELEAFPVSKDLYKNSDDESVSSQQEYPGLSI